MFTQSLQKTVVKERAWKFFSFKTSCVCLSIDTVNRDDVRYRSMGRAVCDDDREDEDMTAAWGILIFLFVRGRFEAHVMPC